MKNYAKIGGKKGNRRIGRRLILNKGRILK